MASLSFAGCLVPSNKFPTIVTPSLQQHQRQTKKNHRLSLPICARQRPSVEDLYRIYVEKNVTKERLAELGVERWRRWESGNKSIHDWDWKVDEQVYITKGCLKVTPHGCPDSAHFYAGDVVRFPKWFSATLAIDGEYEQRYRFLAYGEGEG